MIDRLVCADGGNPDPTATHGKKPDEAKVLELAGLALSALSLRTALFRHRPWRFDWGRRLRRTLADWLTDVNLISAGSMTEKDGYIGYETMRDVT
jgi:hypothetical protein